ncbi:hypothetical protein SNR37_003931 [Agarivorans aestuarii]|uniref:Uncharacterized protein n=1 Tax=Agarivorans aestuarii TaxID=1563703 RepID=A0ABU7G508_9ALTE|nr:hypothetical protein [Agarivorans aestuarii]MEE1674488.1 hypothetical protein [Agarivorans aestuarii]
MKTNSLLAATAASIGIYFALSALSTYFAEVYVGVPWALMDLETVRTFTGLSKTGKFVAIVFACYFAIGFSNRASISNWQHGIYAVCVSLPIVAVATYPDLAFFKLPSSISFSFHGSRFIYFCIAAFVGLFFGFRFNRLKNI